jgi:hypothetical protein
MTVGKGKRPRDPNQLAKWIVDRSTDETPEPEHALEPATSSSSTIPPQHLSAYMAAIGRKGGQIGLKVTPAMEARLTDHVWSLGELCALMPKPIVKASKIEKGLVLKALGEREQA